MKRFLVAFALVTACASSNDIHDRDVALVDLPCASVDATGEVWESAPFPASTDCGAVDAGPPGCCPWLELPRYTRMRIEHGLGRVPRIVDPWISFYVWGVGGTLGSGDVLRIESADATYVVLENHTDQRFYLRVDLR